MIIYHSWFGQVQMTKGRIRVFHYFIRFSPVTFVQLYFGLRTHRALLLNQKEKLIMHVLVENFSPTFRSKLLNLIETCLQLNKLEKIFMYEVAKP